MGRLGSNTAVPTQSTVAVATTTTAVLPANPNRAKLILSNVGANNISLNFAGAAATVTGGVVLAPGATLIDDLSVTPLAINAIAVTGTTNLVVVEYQQ